MAQVISLASFDSLHRAIERFFETLAIKRLKEVIDGMNFESLERESVMGRHKNDSGHMTVFDLIQNAEAIQFGHLDIEEEQFGLLFDNGLDGSGAVIALTNEFDIRLLLEQSADALASERFIIND